MMKNQINEEQIRYSKKIYIQRLEKATQANN